MLSVFPDNKKCQGSIRYTKSLWSATGSDKCLIFLPLNKEIIIPRQQCRLQFRSKMISRVLSSWLCCRNQFNECKAWDKAEWKKYQSGKNMPAGRKGSLLFSGKAVKTTASIIIEKRGAMAKYMWFFQYLSGMSGGLMPIRLLNRISQEQRNCTSNQFVPASNIHYLPQ